MRRRRRIAALAGVAAGAMLVAAVATTAGGAVAAAPNAGRHTAGPVPMSAGHILARRADAPPSTSDCLTYFGLHCYGPTQLAVAYNMAPLWNKGLDGRGRTIVIVDPFGSPTIEADLHTFDQTYGLPDPPSFKVIQPVGAPPPFDATDPDMWGWAFETSLDIEYAHALAPGAKILLVETPVSETEGVTGFPEIVKAENYVINHHLGDVISQSFGATENTFPNAASLLALRGAYVNARANDVTVVSSSGDNGATDYTLTGDLYPYRVTSWPSTDPLVTSVGGTQLTLDNTGNRLSPDVVWNDGIGAGGGGVSSVFSRPSFQDRVAGVVGRQRGTPDVSLSAAVDGGVWVYISFDPDPALAGFWLVGGTSEAAPLFAGIVAIADQAAHHRLGWINPALYSRDTARSGGLVDITSGNNSYASVVGYDASPGYDLASGLGTIDAPRLVRALADR